MRKAILMMLLAVVSSSAAAEWVNHGDSEAKGGFDIYVDPATIRRSGNMAKMWVMYNFKAVQVTAGDRHLSLKTQAEYDCKDEQVRVLFFTAHSGHMGWGNIVHSSRTPGKWLPVPPDSVYADNWKLACGKR